MGVTWGVRSDILSNCIILLSMLTGDVIFHRSVPIIRARLSRKRPTWCLWPRRNWTWCGAHQPSHLQNHHTTTTRPRWKVPRALGRKCLVGGVRLTQLPLADRNRGARRVIGVSWYGNVISGVAAPQMWVCWMKSKSVQSWNYFHNFWLVGRMNSAPSPGDIKASKCIVGEMMNGLAGSRNI